MFRAFGSKEELVQACAAAVFDTTDTVERLRAIDRVALARRPARRRGRRSCSSTSSGSSASATLRSARAVPTHRHGRRTAAAAPTRRSTRRSSTSSATTPPLRRPAQHVVGRVGSTSRSPASTRFFPARPSTPAQIVSSSSTAPGGPADALPPRPHPPHAVCRPAGVLLVLQLVGTLASLYLPSLNGQIIDEGVAVGDTAFILRTGVVMLAVSLVQVLATIGGDPDRRPDLRVARARRPLVRLPRVGQFSAQELSRFGAPTLVSRSTNDVTQVQTVVYMFLAIMVSARS